MQRFEPPASANWSLPWLNNFRQNVQEGGVFDAPDATVRVDVSCSEPPELVVQLRNQGQAGLPAGIEVDLYRSDSGAEAVLGSVSSTHPLLPGQTDTLRFAVPAGMGARSDTFGARIRVDPQNRTFRECREDNNEAVGVEELCGPQ